MSALDTGGMLVRVVSVAICETHITHQWWCHPGASAAIHAEIRLLTRCILRVVLDLSRSGLASGRVCHAAHAVRVPLLVYTTHDLLIYLCMYLFVY